MCTWVWCWSILVKFACFCCTLPHKRIRHLYQDAFILQDLLVFRCVFSVFSQMDLTCQPQWIQSRCLRAACCPASDITMRLKSILRHCSNRKGGPESTSLGYKSNLQFSQPHTAHLCTILLFWGCSFNWIAFSFGLPPSSVLWPQITLFYYILVINRCSFTK